MSRRVRTSLLGVALIFGCTILMSACVDRDAQTTVSDVREAALSTEDREAPAGESPASAPEPAQIRLSSAGFVDGGVIPVIYARPGVEGGANVSIPLEWTGAPAKTRSYALALVDMHEMANEWIHWLVVDIDAGVSSLPEGSSRIEMVPGARELQTTFGSPGYEGPEPPIGSGDHEYRATIYALDVEKLEIDSDPDHQEFLAAIEGHVLARGTVTGIFGR